MLTITEFFEEKEKAMKLVNKIEKLKNDFDKLTKEQQKMINQSIHIYEDELFNTGYYKLLLFFKVIINDLDTISHDKWGLNYVSGGGDDMKKS